ncbi:hypothetical protein OXPF_27140 [Oxobacter pfennigii]|uniref:Uncharacterized protein n=1 Tax=Oxobacter pfennigii TaxID=36849 RepID=A0A0P8W6C2_9CLOT|nr:hypothetical protein [Oxobacter pfennigii]KPU43273.1 hypothetical protein OXPF_27140 [Oxobacter pfennigii]
MKKIIYSILVTLLLAICSGGQALAADNNDKYKDLDKGHAFTIDKLNEIFPEAHIDKDKLLKIEEDFKEGKKPDVMDKSKKPVKSFISRKSKDEVHHLEIYEDGSIFSYGIASGTDGIWGVGSGSSYVSGDFEYFENYTVFWDLYGLQHSMGFKISWRENIFSGLCNITSSPKQDHAVKVSPVRVWTVKSSQQGTNPASAAMTGNAIDNNGNILVGMKVIFEVINGSTDVDTQLKAGGYTYENSDD